MQNYEYKAVAAPTRARKFKGVKGTAAQFAMVLSEVMNDMASDGWEYQRSDSLPVDEKAGLLKGRVETYITMLIFRRLKAAPQEMAGFIEDHSAFVEPIPVAPVADPFEPRAPAAPQEDYAFPQDPPMTSEARASDESLFDNSAFGQERR